jgi:hypothetical protein
VKSKALQLLRIILLLGIVSFGYWLTGCAAPRYAPRYSDNLDVPEAGPEYANAHIPAQGPRSESKMDLLKTADRQQAVIRAARNRIRELENNPQESPDEPDSLIPREQLLEMPAETLEKTVQRQQAVIVALKRRVRELEKKKSYTSGKNSRLGFTAKSAHRSSFE